MVKLSYIDGIMTFYLLVYSGYSLVDRIVNEEILAFTDGIMVFFVEVIPLY